MFAEETRQWAAEVLHTCEAKYSWVADKHCHGIPYTTDPDGNYDNRADEGGTWAVNDGINWWTNGFWGGILWHLYASTGKERFAHIATHSEQLLDLSLIHISTSTRCSTRRTRGSARGCGVRATR